MRQTSISCKRIRVLYRCLCLQHLGRCVGHFPFEYGLCLPNYSANCIVQDQELASNSKAILLEITYKMIENWMLSLDPIL